MIRQIKQFTLNLIAGANIAVVIVMLIVGYSYYLHPGSHPWLACLGMLFPFTLAANLLFVPFWVFFSKPRLLISIIGYALAYVPISIYLPLHLSGSDKPEGDDVLLVLSYNVAGYGGNYKCEYAFDSIYSYIQRFNPDIVCIQEAQTAKAHDKGKDYSKLYPYCDTVRVNKPSMSTVNSVGICSRFPIIRKERIMYESVSNGSVAYFLKKGDDTLLVVNNHLESTHLSEKDRTEYKSILKKGMERDLDRDTMKMETRFLVDKLGEAMVIRSKQAEAVNRYVEQYRQYPVIVCGDFNDTPISYTRYMMSKGLTDCFAASGSGLGLSFNTSGFNFRIDYMMVSDDIEPLKCEIDSKMDVSDHYPLLCWLKMPEKP